MKKVYIKPVTKEILLAHSVSILAGSGVTSSGAATGITWGGEGEDGDFIGARRTVSFDDDDE